MRTTDNNKPASNVHLAVYEDVSNLVKQYQTGSNLYKNVTKNLYEEEYKCVGKDPLS